MVLIILSESSINESLKLSRSSMTFIQVFYNQIVTQFYAKIDTTLDYIGCVRWHPSGEILASSSKDKTAKIIDFKTGKVIYTGISADGSNISYISSDDFF